jgi:hypothetical protein
MRILIGLFFLGFSMSVSAQGNVDGFFKSKGELDLAFSGSYSASKTYFSSVGLINFERNQVILGAYGTYGITDKWNVILNLPLINFKPQDAAVFTKFKLVDVKGENGEFTLAPALGFSFPMSNYRYQSGQAIGQQAIQIQPKLIIQYKHKANWFIQTQGGYNYAFDPIPSSVSASVKLGYIYKAWYFDAWFDYQYGIGGEDYGLIKPDFRKLGVSYDKVGGVIYRNVGKKTGVFVNGSYIFSGRNIGKAYAVSAGFVLKLKTNKKK